MSELKRREHHGKQRQEERIKRQETTTQTCGQIVCTAVLFSSPPSEVRFASWLNSQSARQTLQKAHCLTHEMFSVARIEARQWQQDEKVGGIEIGIPGRFTTYVATQAQIALDQRRDGDIE